MPTLDSTPAHDPSPDLARPVAAGADRPTTMDKRRRAALWRERLADALGRSGLSRSELARRIGADRSTVTDMLRDGTSLPGAHLVASVAETLGVTSDWLLGLTDTPERAADMLAASMQMTDADRTPADAQVAAWFAEARGTKVRHVPASLPDMMKTEAVLEWEYDNALVRTGPQAVEAMRESVAFLRDPAHEFELAVSLGELDAFAVGSGYWAGLGRGERAAQIEHMAALCDELYPSLRLYAFDARRVYSAPVTVFGTALAVIYVGRVYTVFRRTAQVRALSAHFDGLVREASVEARRIAAHLRDLDPG